jgi:hypothetical protein
MSPWQRLGPREHDLSAGWNALIQNRLPLLLELGFEAGIWCLPKDFGLNNVEASDLAMQTGSFGRFGVQGSHGSNLGGN